ncbi:MAG: tripartite tricarboxylate transporter substrate-binding protein [Burkholderiales bacterium]
MKIRSTAIALALCLLGLASLVEAEETYPSRTVRILAPAAGVSTDVIARIFADKLGKRLGQPFVIDNRPGAAGSIAAQAALAAPADGYTVLAVNAAHALNNLLYDNLTYDSLRDFAGVALVADAPFVLAVNPKLGVRTIQEFIALAKQKPGSINYASAGFGSTTHLAGALFARRAGIDIVHVPYKTSANLITDLLGGQVEATFVPTVFLLKQLQDGSVRALAATSRTGISDPVPAPGVQEATGLDYEFTSWNGFVVNAKVPTAVREHLAREIELTAQDEDVRTRLRGVGQSVRVLKTADYDAFMKADADRLAPILRAGKPAAEKDR